MSTDNRSQNFTELVWTPEMVHRFWTFEQTRPENYFSFQVGAVVAHRFRRYLAGRTVDYGAGPGFLVEDILSTGARCAAVEFGKESARQLASRFVNRDIFIGARTTSDLADWKGTFDTAFLIEVVEHLYDDELHQCLSSISSLLKPQGHLIVTTPNAEDRGKHLIMSPESGLLFHRFQHVRSWTTDSLANFLTNLGFKVLTIGTTDFGAHHLAHRRTMPLPLRIVRSVAKLIANQRPHLFAIASPCGLPSSRANGSGHGPGVAPG